MAVSAISIGPLGTQAGHRERHRDAVIAVAVDLPAAKRSAFRAALDAHAIRQQHVFDTEPR